MMIKTLMTAAAATALLTGAAHAGEKMKTKQPAPEASISSSMTTDVPEDRAASAADAGSDSSATAAMPETTDAVNAPAGALPPNATVTTNMVTNGPIADTLQNRQLYGYPQSRAGKLSKPVGN